MAANPEVIAGSLAVCCVAVGASCIYCGRLDQCERRLAEAHKMLADKEKLLQQVYAANLASGVAASASSAAAVQPCGGGGARGPGPLSAPQSTATTATTATTAAAPPGDDLSGASTDAVCAWMRERGLGHHEGLFREHGLQGSDLVDLVAPDGHGFSTEQKISWLGINSQAELVALAAALLAEPSLQPM